MDPRVVCLDEMAEVIGQFLSGGLDVAAFVPVFERNFAIFDPQPESLRGLSEFDRRRLAVFETFLQGSWGGANERIPRRTDWQYGIDTAPYSWVDPEGFRRYIQENLAEAGLAGA